MAADAGLKVQFLFDFGSPNAYLAAKVMPEVESRTGVKFDYVPVLLGGISADGQSSPADYLKGIRNKREQMKRETARFIRRHGITTFRHNPFFPVNTLQLMRGAVAAEAEGPVLAVLPRRLSPHVGRAGEDGRSHGADARRAYSVRHRRRRVSPAKSQEPEVKGRLVQLTRDRRSRAAPLARRRSSLATRCSLARTSFATSKRKFWRNCPRAAGSSRSQACRLLCPDPTRRGRTDWQNGIRANSPFARGGQMMQARILTALTGTICCAISRRGCTTFMPALPSRKCRSTPAFVEGASPPGAIRNSRRPWTSQPSILRASASGPVTG